MTEKDIIKLRDDVEDEKRKVQEKKGQLKLLQSRLEKEFNCKSIKESEKTLSDLKKQIEALEEKKQKKIKKIQELYEIDKH